MKKDLKILNDTKQQYKQQDQIENDMQINLIKAFETCENVLRQSNNYYSQNNDLKHSIYSPEIDTIIDF